MWLDKYPRRVPVIVRPAPGYNLPSLKKSKILVHDTLMFSGLISLIRSRIDLKRNEALFFMIENTLPKMSSTMGELYTEHCERGDILEIVYRKESTFG